MKKIVAKIIVKLKSGKLKDIIEGLEEIDPYLSSDLSAEAVRLGMEADELAIHLRRFVERVEESGIELPR